MSDVQTIEAGTLLGTCPDCGDTVAVENSGEVAECETCGTNVKVVI